MIVNLKSRPFREGDQDGILALMHAVYGRSHGLEYWRWKYKENPLGFFPNWIWVAESDGNIVGHYAMIPVGMKIGSRCVLGAQTLDILTHPDYRRQGIFENLAKNAHAAAQEDGVRLTYGLTTLPRRITPESGACYRGLHKKLGWTHLCFMTRMVKGLGHGEFRGRGLASRTAGVLLRLITRGPSIPRAEGVTIERMEKFDDHANGLWDKGAETAAVMVKRDPSYLNWRIANPQGEYAIFAAREEGELQGYAILRIDREMKAGIVVDLLALLNRRDIVLTLLWKSMDFFAEQQTPYLRCWMMRTHRYHRLLKQFGCIDTPTGMALLFLLINSEETKEYEETLKDPSSWFITSLDSDHV